MIHIKTSISAVSGALALVALAGSVMVYPGVVHSQEKTGALSPGERRAIETVVHDYLLRHPAVIRDAMTALRLQEERAKEGQARKALKKHRTELLQDADSPVSGNPGGDITVIQFFDYNCGYCKKVAGALIALEARDANVRIVYKEFPILSAQSATAAKAALAAQRQGKYAQFHQGLMAAGKTDDAEIQALATKLGLNYATLQKDMKDPKLDAQLARVQQLASALNINGTPAFIIGERLLPGAVDAEALVSIVNQERVRLRGGGVQQRAPGTAIREK